MNKLTKQLTRKPFFQIYLKKEGFPAMFGITDSSLIQGCLEKSDIIKIVDSPKFLENHAFNDLKKRSRLSKVISFDSDLPFPLGLTMVSNNSFYAFPKRDSTCKSLFVDAEKMTSSLLTFEVELVYHCSPRLWIELVVRSSRAWSSEIEVLLRSYASNDTLGFREIAELHGWTPGILLIIIQKVYVGKISPFQNVLPSGYYFNSKVVKSYCASCKNSWVKKFYTKKGCKEGYCNSCYKKFVS